MSLTWSIQTPESGPAIARASGRVTEGVNFAEVIALAEAGPLALHLTEVSQISSTGVREWILFMRALSEKPHPVELLEVSPTLVRQLNMIANFGGAATIRSVVLPYYCDACGNEQIQILELEGASSADIAAEQPCEACGETAEFDDIAQNYLSFASR